MSERSFTIEEVRRAGKKIKHNGGRFISSTPASAARKAFSSIYRSLGLGGRVSMIITIRETTQGSAKKHFKYNVSKVAAEVDAYWIPSSNGDPIKLQYVTKIKSA